MLLVSNFLSFFDASIDYAGFGTERCIQIVAKLLNPVGLFKFRSLLVNAHSTLASSPTSSYSRKVYRATPESTWDMLSNVDSGAASLSVGFVVLRNVLALLHLSRANALPCTSFYRARKQSIIVKMFEVFPGIIIGQH